MRTTSNAAIGLFACFALSSCMTFVEGKKDTSADGEGVEYSLPVPVLRVTPMPDGTIDVQVEMLEDPDNTYRLKTRSYLSSYTLDVVRENGMLKSVSMDAKSDAVAAAVLDAKANLIKAKAAAEEKDREAATAAVKDQAKAISDAKMEVVLADAKLKALQVDPDANKTDIPAAKLAKAVADAKLASLQAAATDTGKSGFNVGKEKLAPAARDGARISAAPVLFRVVPDPDRNTARLVAFEGDRFLETSVAARKPEEPAKVLPLDLRLDDGGVLKKGKPLVMKLVANKPNLNVDMEKTGVTQIGAGDKLLPYVLLANPQPDDGTKSKTTFLVTLKDSVPPGSYNLVLRMLKPVVDSKDGSEPLIADPIPFVVNK